MEQGTSLSSCYLTVSSRYLAAIFFVLFVLKIGQSLYAIFSLRYNLLWQIRLKEYRPISFFFKLICHLDFEKINSQAQLFVDNLREKS